MLPFLIISVREPYAVVLKTVSIQSLINLKMYAIGMIFNKLNRSHIGNREIIVNWTFPSELGGYRKESF